MLPQIDEFSLWPDAKERVKDACNELDGRAAHSVQLIFTQIGNIVKNMLLGWERDLLMCR